MDNIFDLVGKIVISIWVNDDQSAMVFQTNNDKLVLWAEGDCCSESWFADFLGVDALLGQKVIKVEEIELPNYDVEDGRCRQSYDQVYGYRFTTLRGYADLIFRNSSNGCYGGWLTTGEFLPGCLKPIAGDWKA